MYKKYFSQFSENSKHEIYFTAHSHHFWPDCSLLGHNHYWKLSAQGVDEKWEEILSANLQKWQHGIGENLGLSIDKCSHITYAPNTHELLYRWLSCFLNGETLRTGKPVKILTTDSEFYSFKRQSERLEEEGLVELIKVPTKPFHTFYERFIKEQKKAEYDIVFLSQVFYNSGLVIDSFEELLEPSLSNNKEICIDTYHSFFALPVNFKSIEDKVFILGGGYKYSMAGEGACFLYSPPAKKLRPLYSGWYAEFSQLAKRKEGETFFSEDGFHYAGSTLDMTAMFRQNSVFQWMKEKGFTVEEFSLYRKSLQKYFIEKLQSQSTILNQGSLVLEPDYCGAFLSFNFSTVELCSEVFEKLRSVGVLTDFRNVTLRFGFGLFIDKSDIDKAFELMTGL